MSLIDSNSRFAVNPTNIRGIQRSKFDMSHTIKTTFNAGDLVPFDVMEVLPGDTFNRNKCTCTFANFNYSINGRYVFRYVLLLCSQPAYRDWETDRKSTRLNSSHITRSRMPSSA